MDDIEYDRGILNDYLTLMNARAVWERPITQVAGPPPTRSSGSRKYNIIFVDPSNIGRSVVAEGLTKLFGQATVKANLDWRLNLVHSAGFFVRARSDCVDVIEKLNYSYPSFKKPFIAGGALPQDVALDAVFDNKTFEQPFKKTIRDSLNARRSRGLTKDMFKRYDFVIVFTSREHDNTTKLKQALRDKYGNDVFDKGKGRVLHLGAYLTTSGAPKEIVVPKVTKPGAEGRQQWNAKVSQIKTAIKGFLKKEMDWAAPEQAPART
jgi:protein-tyrosine-phosphatase